MRRALVGAEGQEKLKANDCPVFSGVGERYSRTLALFQLSRSKEFGDYHSDIRTSGGDLGSQNGSARLFQLRRQSLRQPFYNLELAAILRLRSMPMPFLSDVELRCFLPRKLARIGIFIFGFLHFYESKHSVEEVVPDIANH